MNAGGEVTLDHVVGGNNLLREFLTESSYDLDYAHGVKTDGGLKFLARDRLTKKVYPYGTWSARGGKLNIGGYVVEQHVEQAQAFRRAQDHVERLHAWSRFAVIVRTICGVDTLGSWQEDPYDLIAGRFVDQGNGTVRAEIRSHHRDYSFLLLAGQRLGLYVGAVQGLVERIEGVDRLVFIQGFVFNRVEEFTFPRPMSLAPNTLDANVVRTHITGMVESLWNTYKVTPLSIMRAAWALDLYALLKRTRGIDLNRLPGSLELWIAQCGGFDYDWSRASSKGANRLAEVIEQRRLTAAPPRPVPVPMPQSERVEGKWGGSGEQYLVGAGGLVNAPSDGAVITSSAQYPINLNEQRSKEHTPVRTEVMTPASAPTTPAATEEKFEQWQERCKAFLREEWRAKDPRIPCSVTFDTYGPRDGNRGLIAVFSFCEFTSAHLILFPAPYGNGEHDVAGPCRAAIKGFCTALVTKMRQDGQGELLERLAKQIAKRRS